MSHVPIALKRPVADKLVATFPRDPAGAADMLTHLTAADFDLPLNAWANRRQRPLARPAHRGHRPPLRHHPRGAGPLGAAQPPVGGRRPGRRLLRRPDRPVRRRREGHPAAPRHLARAAGHAAARLRSSRNDHRRHRLGGHRRRGLDLGGRRRGPGAARRVGRRAAGRLGDRRDRLPARRGHADGAGPGDPPPAGPPRPDVRRHRPLRDPRGVRRPGAGQHQGGERSGLSPRTGEGRRRPRRLPVGSGEPARRHAGARPSVRRHGRAHPQHGGEGAGRDAARARARSSRSAPTAARAPWRCWSGS